MQALLVDPQRTPAVRFETAHPAPRPTTGEVLVEVRLAGICATDLEIARGYMGFRGVPGHEFVGAVVRGSAELKGRRVVADINCPCRRCDMCRALLPTHCRRRTVVGILGRDGAFADLLRVPIRNCHLVPERVSDRQAVFVEPLAAAVHVLDEMPRGRGVRVAVVGAGRLGLLIVQVLKQRNYRPDVIGRNAGRLALAERWGGRAMQTRDAKPARRHDVVVESSGSPGGLRLALGLVRPRGTIILKSTYAEPEPLDLAPVVIDELRVVGSRCGPFPPAIQLLAARKIDVESLITAEYPLARGVEAFAAAARPEHIKVLLRPGGGVMEFWNVGDRQYARFERIGREAGMRHAFAMRPQDVSARTDGRAAERDARRRQMARDLGFDATRLAWCVQIHEPNIELIDQRAALGAYERADGLVTSVPDTPLMTFSADCPLILAYDPRQRIVGMAHASWRCTVAFMARGLVERMTAEFECHPGDLLAGIGPSVGPCCYEVKHDVFAAAAGLPERETLFPRREGRMYFDLWRANAEQLVASGMRAEHVETAGICTLCRNELFYSFRREGPGCGHFGLLAGLCRE